MQRLYFLRLLGQQPQSPYSYGEHMIIKGKAASWAKVLLFATCKQGKRYTFAHRLLVPAAPKPLDDQSKLCGCAHVRGEGNGGGDDNVNKVLCGDTKVFMIAQGDFMLGHITDFSGDRSCCDRLIFPVVYVRFTHTTTSAMMVNRGLGRTAPTSIVHFLARMPCLQLAILYIDYWPCSSLRLNRSNEDWIPDRSRLL